MSSKPSVPADLSVIGNTGLGYEAIKQIAAHSPSHIYLAARSPSKGEAAVQEIKKAHPDAHITYLPLDLTSFASIATATRTFTSKETRLDCLMNNAGIMATPPGETKEGYEIQFGTNHMGHALLTRLLMPILQSTAKEPGADVRIVNMSSEGHNLARQGAATILNQEKLKQLHAWPRYGYSKLANLFFTRELAARYPEITSVAIHPGVIKSDLWASSQKSNYFVMAGMMVMGSFMGTVQQGALNQTWAATGKREDLQSGAYYKPVGNKAEGGGYAGDAKLAKQLWEWTEKELVDKGY